MLHCWRFARVITISHLMNIYDYDRFVTTRGLFAVFLEGEVQSFCIGPFAPARGRWINAAALGASSSLVDVSLVASFGVWSFSRRRFTVLLHLQYRTGRTLSIAGLMHLWSHFEWISHLWNWQDWLPVKLPNWRSLAFGREHYAFLQLSRSASWEMPLVATWVGS